MDLRLALVCLAAGCTTAAHPGTTTDVDAGTGPDAAPLADFCNATDPRATPVTIVATPEAGEQPYIDALTQAQSKIRIEIYEMGYGAILDQLTAKLAAGVAVEIIFDQAQKSVNQKYYDQLAAAGAQVKWSDPAFTYQHSKFIVVDDTTAILSTGNFSKTYSILLERNFVATDHDPADLADLIALFDADWQGVAPAMACTRLVVSPINARPRILDVIAGATSTLTIESMQFADTAVRQAVAARVAAGVDVRVMLADTGWGSSNTTAVAFLKTAGLAPRSIPHLHTKVIVADGKTAYLGSENLSQTSLDHNREVGLVVTDAASIAPLATTFETDWAAGSAM